VIHNRYYNIQGKKYWVEISNNTKGKAFIILKEAKPYEEYFVVEIPLKIAV
jgi:hypothetical protein